MNREIEVMRVIEKIRKSNDDTWKSKTPQGYKKQYTKIGFINMDEKATRRKISNDGKECQRLPLCFLFFFFVFFSFLCPSVQRHRIRYTDRFHAPVAENSAKNALS